PLCSQSVEAAPSSAESRARLRSAVVAPKSAEACRLRPSNAAVQARKSAVVARRYGRKLGNRARAALDEAWDRLLSGKVDRGEDFMAALCGEMANEIAAIERTLKVCPEEREDGAKLNIGQLYLAAVQAAQPKPAVPGDEARISRQSADGVRGAH